VSRKNEGFSDSIERLADSYVAEQPDANARAIELSFRLNAANSAQRSANERLFRSLGREAALGRFAVMRALYFAPERKMSQNEIGNDVRVTAQNVTYLVDALERDGLVTRSPHPTDRRVSIVELTEDGIGVCKQVIPAMSIHFSEIADIFTEDEKKLFNDFLERYRQSADDSYRSE
jgi:DNA-binding MarR family transcriptional regulator